MAVSPIMIVVKTQDRSAIVCIAAAAILWGLNVPLTKLALGWLGPGWLTVARFAVAAPVLALAGRHGLRAAMTARILGSGAVGFGVVIVLQNVGIEHTSVSHAAVVVGAIPVLVALIAAGLGRTTTHPLTWAGYGVALVGIACVAGARGGGASTSGDLLVLGSAVVSAGFIVIQPGLLAGRDAASVTAVQFAGGALVALPVAALSGGLPHGPVTPTPVLALAALALAGTPLPFWLFAFGQARVSAELAGAFLNLEPVVGAAAGWLALGEPATFAQILGAAAVLGGIAMSTLEIADGPVAQREQATNDDHGAQPAASDQRGALAGRRPRIAASRPAASAGASAISSAFTAPNARGRARALGTRPG
jgi:O-acetylserine/cysteine efflux transporter